MRGPLGVVVVLSLLVVSLAAQATAPASRPAPFRVTLSELPGRCRVEVGGELFTEYVYEGWPNPILYPVIGARGRAMTRDFPMKKGKDEASDHPHHRSLWFTHGDVNGHDFWAGKGRIVQERLATGQDERRPDRATITVWNKWVVGEEVICRDERRLTFLASSAGRFIDYEVTIRASEGDLVFGDTKEGSMALRLTPTLRLRGKVAKGRVVSSEGVGGRQVWGKRARWVDYWGPVGGETVGVALFDHPKNHGYPCRWHARDYGLFAANPWGIHHFEGAPKGTGDMRLAEGKTLSLRYRFFFHAGDPEQADVAREFERWAGPRPTTREKKTKRRH